MTEEQWQRHFDGRLSKVETKLQDIDTRLAKSEQVEAVAAVHRENMEKNMEDLKTGDERIQNNLTWVVRTVLGGILLAIVSFVMNGGLQP